MSVVIETTLGDMTVDLYMKTRPRACLNFLKLCKTKYYNFNLFHTVSRGFIAQTGDPTGSRTGGESIHGVLEGPLKRYFEPETNPRIKHTIMGLLSFVGNEDQMIGSQFFFTLGADLTYLDDKHCVFGEVTEGQDVLEIINEAICDSDDRPYQDIRITHTVVLDDPFPDPKRLLIPARSPSPSAERMQGGRIAPDEDIDETAGKSAKEIHEMMAEREAKARATILEMVGDLPDADMAPPENVLFVCKLNPVTTDDDLEIIFSRFGKIKSCEVIRDKKTGDSLQYAFVEFTEQKSCEDAYFKMDNVLIDDRRIHVDFSQSVSKIKWLGKGRGVKNFGVKEQDIGKGNYQKNGDRQKINQQRNRSRSPDRNRRNRSRSQERTRRDRDYQVERNRNRRDRSRSQNRNQRQNSRSVDRNRRDRPTSRSFDRNRQDTGWARNRNYQSDRRYQDRNRQFRPRSPDRGRNRNRRSRSKSQNRNRRSRSRSQNMARRSHSRSQNRNKRSRSRSPVRSRKEEYKSHDTNKNFDKMENEQSKKGSTASEDNRVKKDNRSRSRSQNRNRRSRSRSPVRNRKDQVEVEKPKKVQKHDSSVSSEDSSSNKKVKKSTKKSSSSEESSSEEEKVKKKKHKKQKRKRKASSSDSDTKTKKKSKKKKKKKAKSSSSESDDDSS